jgi:hypothetical protein
MAFRPIIHGQPALMDARIFRDEPMGIRPELLDKLPSVTSPGQNFVERHYPADALHRQTSGA